MAVLAFLPITRLCGDNRSGDAACVPKLPVAKLGSYVDKGTAGFPRWGYCTEEIESTGSDRRSPVTKGSYLTKANSPRRDNSISSTGDSFNNSWLEVYKGQ